MPFVPARLLPLVLVAVAVPVLGSGGALDWVLAFAAAVLTVGGGTWPYAVTVAQAVLLAAAADSTVPARFVVQFLALYAVLEVLMRRDGWWRAAAVVPCWVATATLWWTLTGDFARTALATAVLAGSATILGVHMWSLRRWMRQYHAQVAELTRLRSVEAAAVRAAERGAIARELHDLVAHHVASIVLRVGVVRHVAGTADARVAEVLDDVHATGNAALGDLRELVHVLRDPAAPLLEPADLLGALDAVATRIEQAGLPVTSEVDAAVARLDAVRRLAVLRVAQEGLTNALRHAEHATGARLRVSVGEDDVVRIEVIDDGRPSAARDRPGYGLAGLSERVDAVGGAFEAGPGVRGWRLAAVLPPVRMPSGGGA
ncbi:histidine kinase [Amycolatopsis minnesotensis]|uniref:histidine kinase n=1 Tax=Amycolatopsis minnesotensis TaxID=337894 RepID=A0ABN2QUD0_9PSEU